MTTDSAATRPRWRAVARGTWAGFRERESLDRAAALTYYAVLSVFPALLVLVSIVGLLRDGAVQPLIDNLTAASPGPAREIALNTIDSVRADSGAAGGVLVVALAAAIWSASRYVGAFMRAGNAIWGVDEDRPLWKTIPLRLAITLGTLVFLSLGAVAVVVTGPVARQAGDIVGLGSTAVQVWDIAKWPVLAGLLVVVLAMLYDAAPDVREPRVARRLTPGSVLAVVLWLAASGLFALFVANFGSYNKTYGALGGFIVFLIWLWLSNVAVLLGAELNAELDRSAGRDAPDT